MPVRSFWPRDQRADELIRQQEWEQIDTAKKSYDDAVKKVEDEQKNLRTPPPWLPLPARL